MFSGVKGSALLEFFRNLTPQVLFFGCAVYLAIQIDFHRFSLNGADIQHFLSFVGCCLLWLMSFAANFQRFFEAFVSASPAMEKAFKAYGEHNRSFWKALAYLPVCAWKLNRRGVVEAMVVMVLTYAALTPVSLMAVQSASSMWRAMNESSVSR